MGWDILREWRLRGRGDVGIRMFGSSKQRDTAADGGALQGDRFQGVGGSGREGGEDGLYLTGNAKVDVASS